MSSEGPYREPPKPPHIKRIQPCFAFGQKHDEFKVRLATARFNVLMICTICIAIVTMATYSLITKLISHVNGHIHVFGCPTSGGTIFLIVAIICLCLLIVCIGIADVTSLKRQLRPIENTMFPVRVFNVECLALNMWIRKFQKLTNKEKLEVAEIAHSLNGRRPHIIAETEKGYV